jgi:hypothetical protein
MGGRGAASGAGAGAGPRNNAPKDDGKQRKISEKTPPEKTKNIESLTSEERPPGTALEYKWKSEQGADIEIKTSYHEITQKNIEFGDYETKTRHRRTDKVSINGSELKDPDVGYNMQVGDYAATGTLTSGKNKGRKVATKLPPDIKEKLFGADIRERKRIDKINEARWEKEAVELKKKKEWMRRNDAEY